MVKIEEPSRATSRNAAREVIAMEYLAPDRCGHRRIHPGELVGLEVADVDGIADQPRRGRMIDRERFTSTFDDALLARLACGHRGLHRRRWHIRRRARLTAQRLNEVVVG